MTPEELRKKSDWQYAFEYAGEPHPCVGAACSLAACSIDDVTDVIASSEGENEGPMWIGVFVMRDGRYLFLGAVCDNTGWDCQSNGSSWVADEYESLFQFGIGGNDRWRLRLEDRLDLDATRLAREFAQCTYGMVFTLDDANVRVVLGESYCDCRNSYAGDVLAAMKREKSNAA